MSESEKIIFISNPKCTFCQEFQKKILVLCKKEPTDEIIKNPEFTLNFSDRKIQLSILYIQDQVDLKIFLNNNRVENDIFKGTPFVCYIKKKDNRVIENYNIKEYGSILDSNNALDSIIKGAEKIFPISESVKQNSDLSSKRKYLKYKLKYISMK
jgi:hypothetical protein